MCDHYVLGVLLHRSTEKLSLWNRLSVIPKVGWSVAGVLWNRRAIIMFFGGAILFHCRGDDFAV